MENKPVIYIVDDDAAVRESIVALLKLRDLETRAFDSAEAFLRKADLGQSGCVVLDIRMSGMSGLELLAHLREKGSQLPVIMVTAHADIPTAVKAMKQGADTFLEKPCSETELWSAVEEVLNRDRQHHTQQRLIADIKTRLGELSPDELQVYKMLVDGLQNKQVASRLGIGLRTVELRRSTLMKKMQANSFSELVRMAVLG
ncbi:MAG TPA: response regulator, partial [Pirellulaceae bacterium]|nr:response regulator [Pirellulaceae bacterium]